MPTSMTQEFGSSFGKILPRLIIFLIVNFGGLALGGLFTATGVNSDWYLGLDRAPWEPPGWAFGTAWTIILLSFSFFMAYAWDYAKDRRRLLWIYIIQWLINFSWPLVFFYYNQAVPGLIVMLALIPFIAYLFFAYWPRMKSKALLALPYLFWLLLAMSLNAYIVINN